MISVLTSAVHMPIDERTPKLRLQELGNVQDAVEPFTQLILRSGCNLVRLQCIMPNHCPSSETCLDLHDLHEMRSRFLQFVHTVLESLKRHDIAASYKLTPSNSPYCIVCTLPPGRNASTVQQNAIESLQSTTLTKRKTVFHTNLESGPALIFT